MNGTRGTYVVGLTGGLASGKSTVTALFAAHGVPIIDTDLIARELVAPGQPAFRRILGDFGADLAGPDGQLDRARLRERVFGNPDDRCRLEAILHPLIRQSVQDRIAALDAPYCLVVIPLLVETAMADLVDRVLVVDCPEHLQYQRAMARDHCNREAVAAILRAQAGREARLACADDVIVNDSGPEALAGRVEVLHRAYQAIAAQRT
jgi:dephospho-CoA kinase